MTKTFITILIKGLAGKRLQLDAPFDTFWSIMQGTPNQMDTLNFKH